MYSTIHEITPLQNRLSFLIGKFSNASSDEKEKLQPLIDQLKRDVETKIETSNRLLEFTKNIFDEVNHKIGELEENVSTMVKSMIDDTNRDQLMFYLLHGHWKDDVFVVTKEEASLLFNGIEEDITFSKEEITKIEDETIAWFAENKNFANYTQYEDFREIQWGFHNNIKVKDFLEAQAKEGNIYCQDYLLFDAIQVSQYHPNLQVRNKAWSYAFELYNIIEDVSGLPLNHIYRAVLFDDYSGLSKEKMPFDVAYCWNLSPIKVLKNIREKGKVLKETERVMAWLVEETLKEK